MKKNEFGVYMPEDTREDPNDFYRNKIFNEWFAKQEKFFRTAQNKKYNDVSIIVNEPLLNKIYNEMYKKYCKNYTEKVDCVNDCISYTWEALTKFEPRNMTWEYLSSNIRDRRTKNKLMSYIRTIVSESMKKMHIKSIETTTSIKTSEGRKTFHLYYELEINSLNVLVNPSHSEYQTELVNLFEKSYWHKNNDYKLCTFLKWFLDNKELILTKKERNFLDKLESVNYSAIDKNFDLGKVGLKGFPVKKELNIIYKKIEREYKKQNKYISGGFIIEQIVSEIKTLGSFLKAIERKGMYCKTEKELLELVSKEIMKRLSKQAFQKVIYDELEPNVTRQIIKVYGSAMLVDNDDFQLIVGSTSLNKKIVTSVIKAVHERIDRLVKRKKEELEILKRNSSKEKKKYKVKYIKPPEDGSKSIFMVLNPYGILIPKEQP